MVDGDRPWTRLYPEGVSADVPIPYTSLPEAWRARVSRSPERRAIAYFDGSLTARELDRASDALAAALHARGATKGDRVGIYLQNIPQYAISLLALWKLGAAAVVLNPMYRRAELRRLVDDAGAVGIICADTALAETRDTLAGGPVRWLISTSDRDLQTRDDPRVFAGAERPAPSADGDLLALLEEFGGCTPPQVEVDPGDVALLTYTSGTTGHPKGAMNTHANVLNVAMTYSRWADVGDGDVVLALAPLFHITGAVSNAALSLVTDTTLVFANRFHPEVTLEAIAEHGVTFTIGSITAFNAIARLPHAGREHFRSVKHVYSGGAPIPPATVERYEQRFGIYIHNGYGMTETSSAVIAVPPGFRAPVDGASGSLSIGVPLPNMVARIVDPVSGEPLPPGEQGELELTGPQVIPGYWRNEEATARTLPGGRLRTGDGAVMDADGWVYLVDRLKDQINTSGFKVWPREVEDALYEHPAVDEAAVVGRPDEYRGEQVIAFVSLKPGAAAGEHELIEFVRQRLATYKCPRAVFFVDELPKTQTGKIRRRALRDAASTPMEV